MNKQKEKSLYIAIDFIKLSNSQNNHTISVENKNTMLKSIEDFLVEDVNKFAGYEKYKREKEKLEQEVIAKNKVELDKNLDEKILTLYKKGNSTEQISDILNEMYDSDVSRNFISKSVNKILPEIKKWQERPLKSSYPFVFIDATQHKVHVTGENRYIKKYAYSIIGIGNDGVKDVLDILIWEKESSIVWLNMLEKLKTRGVEHVGIITSDGLSGMKKAIESAFPKASHQRCIVHMKRNTLEKILPADRNEFKKDLLSIYTAHSEETGKEKLEEIKKK